MAKNGGLRWKSALESAGITIINVNKSLKRKISYKHWILPNVLLTNCIKEEKKNQPIIKNNVVDTMLQCVHKLNNGIM